MYSLKEREMGEREREREREVEGEGEREIDSHAFEAVSMLSLTDCLFDIFKLLDVISQLKQHEQTVWRFSIHLCETKLIYEKDHSKTKNTE